MTQPEILDRRIQQLAAQIAAWRVQRAEADYSERYRLNALIKKSNADLDQTEHAYQRALAGMQQSCERCYQPISPDRLAAMPEATLCIRCAWEVESIGHVSTVRAVFSARSDTIPITA